MVKHQVAFSVNGEESGCVKLSQPIYYLSIRSYDGETKVTTESKQDKATISQFLEAVAPIMMKEIERS